MHVGSKIDLELEMQSLRKIRSQFKGTISTLPRAICPQIMRDLSKRVRDKSKICFQICSKRAIIGRISPFHSAPSPNNNNHLLHKFAPITCQSLKPRTTQFTCCNYSKNNLSLFLSLAKSGFYNPCISYQFTLNYVPFPAFQSFLGTGNIAAAKTGRLQQQI